MNAVRYVHKICEYYYAPCSALHNATKAATAAALQFVAL